ncbi:HutD family protein [Pandoraea fibrosis]|uniref:HutD family protein n=1 Tax=Pandoraea fibrosis TaxID=1891094 RepID=A0ABX6HP32_9BURK|nr:HutD family protein [Pandoraea fibrosis]QHE94074.1 HutD family protein [Pandoraea fibrosis]QHF12362.1 HutD family protein [Pandoraea fibrosis]
MKLQVLGPADFLKMPWKNGQGVTTELAVARRADDDGFDWRISTATVAVPGPFSVFSGIDRSLAIVRGGTLTLNVEGRPDVTLTTRTPAYPFAGELAVSSTPVLETAGVPIDDFNVMTRRAEWQHTLVQHHLDGAPVTWALPVEADAVAFLYCANGQVRLTFGDGQTVSVAEGHALRIDGSDSKACELHADANPAEVFLTTLSRR